MELIELLEKIVSDYHNSQNMGDVNNSQNMGDINNSQNMGDVNNSQNMGDVNNSQNMGDVPNIDEKIAGIENQLKSIFNLIQERNINTPVTHNNPDNISDVYRNLVNRRNKEDK